MSWHYTEHRGTGSSSSAQHPKPSAVVESSSSSDPPSPVMTSNRARHELIQLLVPTIINVRLLGTRRQSGTVPLGTVPRADLAGDGPGGRDAPPSPSPIWRGRGRSPVPDSHRGVRALPGPASVQAAGSTTVRLGASDRLRRPPAAPPRACGPGLEVSSESRSGAGLTEVTSAWPRPGARLRVSLQ